MRAFWAATLTGLACICYAGAAVVIGFDLIAKDALAEAVATAPATAPAPIDLRPLFDETLIPLAAAALLALGGAALKRLYSWLGVKRDDVLAERADDALHKAIAYAEKKAGAAVATASWAQPEIRSNIVAAAVRYAADQIPDTLKQLGYDPRTDEGRAAIERMVDARLPAPAASTQ